MGEGTQRLYLLHLHGGCKYPDVRILHERTTIVKLAGRRGSRHSRD